MHNEGVCQLPFESLAEGILNGGLLFEEGVALDVLP